MSNLIKQTKDTMFELLDITEQMQTGIIPNMYELLALQSRLIRIYYELGASNCTAFKATQQTTLKRKQAHANYFKLHRLNGKSITEANNNALLETGEEANGEIEAVADNKQYQILLSSVEKALDHARQVVSKLNKAEKL